MSNKWITDRLPTEEDMLSRPEDVDVHYVWTTDLHGELSQRYFKHVALGTPWQPITKPAPYVKPKRWTVEWDEEYSLWCLKLNCKFHSYVPCNSLPNEAAQRICDIYNEVLP